MWDTSCPDWRRRLLAGESLVPELPLFPEQTAKALRVFKRLRVPDLHGRPRMEEAAGDWLFPIVAAIFGSYDPELKRRMVQEFFWLVPKKNGKTSTSAAIMVTALILNERPEAEFVLVAPTKDVADIAFRQAANTIKADPELQKLFHHQQHIRTITHRDMGAKLQVKAADTEVITGGKQVGTLVDELHVLGAKPNAAEVMVELRGALAARPDGFLIVITTQSKKPPAGVMKAELQKARAVRDGHLALPLLPVLYELPPDLAAENGWKRREYWPLVNPNLGRSVDEGFLARELEAAEAAGPEQMALLASQHFNVEVGLALHTNRWAGADLWERRAEPNVAVSVLIAECDAIVAGLDEGGRDDLDGLALLGRRRGTGDWLLWNRAWCDPVVLERRKSEANRLQDLVAAGDLVLEADSERRTAQAVEIIARVHEAGLLAGVGLDQYGPGKAIVALAAAGIEGQVETAQGKAPLIEGVPQGWKLSGAIKLLELRLADGRCRHAGQPLMAWCVGNAKVEPRGNAVSITKQAAGVGKIDPLIATFNAVALMMRDPQPAGFTYTGI